jgi:hypothetical protein
MPATNETAEQERSRRLLAILDGYDDLLRPLQEVAVPTPESAKRPALLASGALPRVLSQAFWALGQSKYVLGPGQLTAGQYDLRMRARRMLRTSFAETGSVTLLERTHLPVDELVSSVPPADINPSGGMRQRRQVSSDHSESTHDDKLMHAGKSVEITAVKIPDPIQWFAFLPPQALRDAQRHFAQALEGYVQLAALKRDLLLQLSAYEELLGDMREAECE